MVFETDPELTEWTRTCLRQADLVLSVGSSTDDYRLNDIEEFASSSGAVMARSELVLVHPRQLRPRGTASWLGCRNVADYHHLRAKFTSGPRPSRGGWSEEEAVDSFWEGAGHVGLHTWVRCEHLKKQVSRWMWWAVPASVP